MSVQSSPAASAPKKGRKKFIILAVVLAVAASASIAGAVIWQHVRPFSPYKFQYNKWEEPYSQHVPLEEMSFGVYSHYFGYSSGIKEPDYVETLPLPCDIRYYANPGDKEPVLTLEKGTVVHVPVESGVSAGYSSTNNRGTPLRTWPSYEKGWRYGLPFVPEGSESPTADSPMYYVRTEDIRAVAAKFVDANWGILSPNYFRTKREAREFLVLTIDRTLYQEGCYCSPDL